jgi:hypothetical protein
MTIDFASHAKAMDYLAEVYAAASSSADTFQDHEFVRQLMDQPQRHGPVTIDGKSLGVIRTVCCNNVEVETGGLFRVFGYDELGRLALVKGDCTVLHSQYFSGEALHG